MPLRDHFRPPLDDLRHWESLHGGWPMMIVANLRGKLLRGFFAEVRVHSGASAEIDVATFEREGEGTTASGNGEGGVATDLPAQDEYEVRVYDERRKCRLVAAVEIVSPANKDRPDHRRAFVGKCGALLGERVSVVIVDIVTTRSRNLYEELLEQLGHSDPNAQPLYAAACRLTKREDWALEAWAHPLGLGQPLPTLPLWLADDRAIPLELEVSYEQSCEILGIP